MRVVIVKDYKQMSRAAALLVAKQVRSKPTSVLGLATGSTPLGTYKELVRMHRRERLDFSGVRTFNLDEYFRIDPSHSQSYHTFMFENLFDKINMKPDNISIPDGMTKDVEKFCAEYERRIRDAGGLDLQLLGIGRDGHIGFNEPGSSLGSRTRLKTLTEETVRDNARFFEDPKKVPRLAITMGVGTILEAKKLVMLASGEGKADAVKKSIEGPVTAQVTASALQLHPSVTVVVDGAAAKLLRRRKYYTYVEKMAEEYEAEVGI